MAADARRLAGQALADALRESRAASLRLAFDGDDWSVPQRPGLNPIAWELGHLAWFGEFWILRGPHRLGADGFVHAAKPARIAGPDAIFDSARLAHADRWSAALPRRTALGATLATQLEACIDALPAEEDDAALYFHRLVLFHEDMHGEAFAWSRATLGRSAPPGLEPPAVVPRAPALSIEGGEHALGRAATAPGFSFDNEQPGRTVRLPPFEIDAAPLTQGAFLRFVDAGGYANANFWPGAAGAWRREHPIDHPQRWRRAAGGGWETRWFDHWQALAPDAPLIHVNAWEAEAYCLWAKRRLPSAAEWERAAAQPSFLWGRSVWEWTADAFAPHPGFVAGPYADYSRPWFGDHRELRGGAFATSPRLHHPAYRNFFTPERSDVFAGFRTAALGA